MSRFVRASKFRHVFGTVAKREACYDNVRVSNNAWDSNFIAVNAKYISVNWEAAGGGAFGVIPLANVGRLPPDQPLFSGHSSAVLDTAFSPFDDNIIASGSEDTTVMIWRIPEGEFEEHQTTPLFTLQGHERKVGHVLFHPTAANVLASSSSDKTVKLWDVERGVERQTLDGHSEVIQSITWNYNGSLMATTCRDKKIRVFDVRTNQIVQEGPGHAGVKGSRIVWMGDYDRLATTGHSRYSDRQLGLWDTHNMAKPLKMTSIDSSSGILMPFYDADVKMLYLAGKGDGNIRYYEYENDDLFFLSEYKAADPQRGIAFMPKHALHVRDCEIARAYKLSNTTVEPVSFVVPRKAGTFQSDIFPLTASTHSALTADEFFNGKDANPILMDLATGSNADEAAVAAAAAAARARTPSPLPPKKAPSPAAAVPSEPAAPRQLTPAQREIAKAADQSSSAAAEAPVAKRSEPAAATPTIVEPVSTKAEPATVAPAASSQVGYGTNS
ncbi:hypothetical protein THASP1DRAFT_16790 [Thamnocephalis sphaerospora]|uniref:Coronin n=1 Tax=Thamnocephalis sphaerospora TaxID=78915 RepID=A0A4P9XNR0_9FUNG|nr:hypothetical protein THASP1DRAFT_16790 [Thamnocephalis sphaerospora]|eukprot:RKP07623.1 hypothetical protein THASP1DRAFT_16790 [Thamnocephalis sphaerospora]